MKTKLLGAFGEACAADYLKKKRYKILGMNYRCSRGEIDIIARNGKTVVFVEVKLRRSRSYARASDYVDNIKQRKIILASQSWLEENGLEADCRFDVIEVYVDPEGRKVTELNHIKEAF
jgi:putative endonuclease